MLDVRPDRELLVTVDLARSKLLAFELEWDDAAGRRHYLTWGPAAGFGVGVVDLDQASADPEGLVELRIPLAASPDPELLETVRRMITASDLGSPVSELILGRLSA